uniref:PB1 domain-containing protein n=1 Tax=Glossina brevipalpis TaxID=37001 RepID=A0A1A9WMZ7_9MUSC
MYRIGGLGHQQSMSSSMLFLKVTYKLQEDKHLHIYLKTPLLTFEDLRKQIEIYFFEYHQLPACGLRIYWLDEELEEIDIFNQHDYETFMVLSSECRRLFVTPVNKYQQEANTGVNRDLSRSSSNNDDYSNRMINLANDLCNKSISCDMPSEIAVNESESNDIEKVNNEVMGIILQEEFSIDARGSDIPVLNDSGEVIFTNDLREMSISCNMPTEIASNESEPNDIQVFNNEELGTVLEEEIPIDPNGSDVTVLNDSEEITFSNHLLKIYSSCIMPPQVASNESESNDIQKFKIEEIGTVCKRTDLQKNSSSCIMPPEIASNDTQNFSNEEMENGLQEEASIDPNVSNITELSYSDSNNEEDNNSEIIFINDLRKNSNNSDHSSEITLVSNDILKSYNEKLANAVQEEVPVDLNRSYPSECNDSEDDSYEESFIKIDTSFLNKVDEVNTNDNKDVEIINAPVISGHTAEDAEVNNNDSTEAEVEITYHADEFINSGVKVLMSMGFSNDGNLLAQLLESVNGIIPEALDLLSGA